MCFLPKTLIIWLIIAIYTFKVSSGDGTLELFCKADSDCSSFEDKMTLSTCLDSNCHCMNVRSKEQVSCSPKKVIVNNKIGECRSHTCDVPNSHCNLTTMKCACNDGFVESTDEMRCIMKTVQLSQPCEMNEQCIRFDQNSYCFQGACQCLENYTEHDKSCRSLVKIGQHCLSNQECKNFTTNALCSDHKCLCEKNFVTSKDGRSCLQCAFYNESCEEKSQCENGLGPGSVCDNGKCVCDDVHMHVLDNNRSVCQRRIFHGDGCDEHQDCLPYTGEKTMMCLQKRCTCRNGYELFDAYKKECVRISGATSRSSSFIAIVVGVVLLIFVNIHILSR